MYVVYIETSEVKMKRICVLVCVFLRKNKKRIYQFKI